MLSSISISKFNFAAQTAGWTVLGCAIALVALEVLMRLLPVSTSTATGYYYDPMILTYPAHHEFWTATGWNLENARRHRTNNFGFLSSREFSFDPGAVALIGDSFVEANMLPPQDRLAAQLEASLRGRHVFALGAPGTSLLDYAERLRFAAQRFGIHDTILFLESGDVGEALCGSGNIAASCLDPRDMQPRIQRQQRPGLFKRVIRGSALAQYLFSQLNLDPVGWARRIVGALRGVSSDSPAAALGNLAAPPAADAERIIQTFFDRVQPYRTGELVIVLAPYGWNPRIRDLVVDAAARHTAIVIETHSLLDDFERRSHFSIFVSPRDKHLNRLALALIAREIARVLQR